MIGRAGRRLRASRFTTTSATLEQHLAVNLFSGAAIDGSPASGGYAGSKATQRFIAGYAQDESRRAGLTEEAYVKSLGELLTPQMAGSGYVLTGAGLQKPP